MLCVLFVANHYLYGEYFGIKKRTFCPLRLKPAHSNGRLNCLITGDLIKRGRQESVGPWENGCRRMQVNVISIAFCALW